MKRWGLIGVVTLGVLASVGCSSDGGNTDNQAAGGQGGAGGATGGTAGSGGATAMVHAAQGVSIQEVAIYQGVKRSLMVGGQAMDSDVPLIAGRDALVRVFYATDSAYAGAEVTARLNLAGGDPIEVKATLGGASTDAELETTLNFQVPGARIGENLDWSVEILEDGDGADNPDARFPAEGSSPLAVEGKANTFRIILAPFRYNADGSGRLPNLDETQVKKITDRIKSLYPVSEVETRVRDVTEWSGALGPDGSGWQQLGITLAGFRNSDGEGDDVYYYGIFNPADSFFGYCGSGCLLGVTLLNNNPPETGSAFLRLALGVGFETYAASTAAHELGHAHGREHVLCGPGLDPSSVDKNYPHDGKTIGVWGYDITSGELRDPAKYSDIMGYCNTQHISDYNYRALFERGQRVNLPRVIGELDYDVITVDGSGAAEFATSLVRQSPLEGLAVEVSGKDAKGTRSVRGEFFHYDHLPGGWLVIPKDTNLERAEFVVDGQRYQVQR
ncbi:MAG: M66 family metalloprotease [Polyangiaceae bacterium]